MFPLWELHFAAIPPPPPPTAAVSTQPAVAPPVTHWCCAPMADPQWPGLKQWDTGAQGLIHDVTNRPGIILGTSPKLMG